MRKKKQMEIYKCGMEAGAAPFEKKYEETAKQIRKTSGHIDELARNQRKNKKIVDAMIDGEQQNQQRIQDLNKIVETGEKTLTRYKRKTENIELMMPSVQRLAVVVDIQQNHINWYVVSVVPYQNLFHMSWQILISK